MADRKKVGVYFKARKKVKKAMRDMLKPKARWTKKIISDFENIFRDYKEKYSEHEELCKKRNNTQGK